MICLGKQDVLVETFVDGVMTRSGVERRAVYHLARGTYEVNWLAGGRREITRREDGSFYWRIDIRSIRAYSSSEVLGQ